jgi:tyrosyl-tRNA synthetase
MDVENILKFVNKKPTCELLTEERLKQIVESGEKLKHYIGFEISGFLHIGTGIYSTTKIVDFQKAGIETTIFLADWHSWLNNKLGGDLDLIKKVAVTYYKESFKKCVEALGGDPDKINFVLGSELYDELGNDYWKYFMKCCIETPLSRIKKSITIAGRKEGESVKFATLVYVPLQVADIYGLNVNVAHGGLDQRKAHVIAKDYGEKIGGYVPVAVHHKLQTGLHITLEIREKMLNSSREEFENAVMDIKMSKSKPDTCIFLHDSPEDIKRKFRKAFCPHGEIELNPVWEMVEWLIFRDENVEFTIVNEKTGEEKTYTSYEEIKNDWINKKIHPLDLKNAVAEWLIRTLEPIRKFYEGSGKKYLEEMNNIMITR